MRFHGDNVDYLFGKNVNFSMPIFSLIYWLRGLHDSNPGVLVSTLNVGNNGRYKTIMQDWRVEYLNYQRYPSARDNGLLLPQHIKISSRQLKGFTHEILISDWNITEVDAMVLPAE